VAKNKGVTDDEIGAVLSIVMAVSAGKAKALLVEAKKKMK